MRTVTGCINCGDEREIVSHGLCAKCNQARWREQQMEFAIPDRSQRGYLAERNKEHGRLVGIVRLVDETQCFSDEERLTLKALIQAHLLKIVLSLSPMAEPDSVEVREPGEDVELELTVNGADEVNVNSNSDQPEEEEYTPAEWKEG